MNKAQFWILNFVGGICALLIVANLILMRTNEELRQTLMSRQNDINGAQQVENTMKNLVMRIAQGGQSEPALSNLLVRQDLRINVPQETPAKPPEAPAKPPEAPAKPLP